jgi:gag-polypeptide of LTR copia-type
MWIKLRELYAPKGQAARYMLLKEVVRASLDSSTSVEAYINSIKKYSRGLANMGTIIPEWMLVSFLIFGLNESYNNLVTVLENLRTEDDLTFENAVATLMEESRHKELYEDPMTLLLRAPKSLNTQKKEVSCEHCHKKGHMKEQCFKLYPELCSKPK